MTARLPQVVGSGNARRMSLTGEVVDAERALRMGLVTEVVAHERLRERAMELAAAVAEVPVETLLPLKQMYTEGGAGTVGAALAVEKAITRRHRPDIAALERRRVAVTERNRRQLGKG